MPRSVVPFTALVAVVLSVSFAQSEPPAKGDKPVRVALFAGGGAAKTKGPAAAAAEKTSGIEVPTLFNIEHGPLPSVISGG